MFAEALLQGVPVDDLDGSGDDPKGTRSLTRGQDPEVRRFDRFEDEVASIAAWVQEQPPERTCLMARTRKQRDRYRAALEAAGIATYCIERSKAEDPTQPGLRLVTMHWDMELSLLYVALTRARREVLITSANEVSWARPEPVAGGPDLSLSKTCPRCGASGTIGESSSGPELSSLVEHRLPDQGLEARAGHQVNPNAEQGLQVDLQPREAHGHSALKLDEQVHIAVIAEDTTRAGAEDLEPRDAIAPAEGCQLVSGDLKTWPNAHDQNHCPRLPQLKHPPLPFRLRPQPPPAAPSPA